MKLRVFVFFCLLPLGFYASASYAARCRVALRQLDLPNLPAEDDYFTPGLRIGTGTHQAAIVQEWTDTPLNMHYPSVEHVITQSGAEYVRPQGSAKWTRTYSR